MTTGVWQGGQAHMRSKTPSHPWARNPQAQTLTRRLASDEPGVRGCIAQGDAPPRPLGQQELVKPTLSLPPEPRHYSRRLPGLQLFAFRE
jgi:hypothetical protein